MIWDLIEQSEFDKHFSSVNLSITTLLLDENIITQLKNQNPKLLNYINEHKKKFIAELIEYTVTMPVESDGYDRCHKLPYISSQLLAIDSELIYEEFFDKEVQQESNLFWLRLIQFLETDASENQILMGYFEKVFNNLYNGNKIKTTQIVAHHLQKFIHLLHNGSIGDILKKSLILLNTSEGAALAQRQKILLEVIDRFSLGNEEQKTICSDILTEVINKFQAFSSGDILVEKLQSNPQLHEIYSIEHNTAINDFLISLLRKSQQRIVNENDVSIKILTIPQKHLENLATHLKNQVQNIDKLLSSDSYIMNQNKVLVRKSNKKIYSILALASLAIEQSLSDFITSKFISNLWKLIILFPYNNILHVHVVRIFTSLLKTSKTQIKNILLDHYQAYILELFKNNFQMFRPLILTIWKEAKIHPIITTDQEIVNEFNLFVQEHLEPLMKYQINKNSIQHHHAQAKLIVDEEDKQNPAKLEENEQKQPQEIESQAIHVLKELTAQRSIDFEATTPTHTQPEKDSFDFFSGWQTQKKQSKPIEAATKTNLFDDFTNFF